MADLLFTVERTCKVCNKKFEATRVRSRLVKVSQDTDFCSYYKNVNPYYYSVWVCPHCGYAAKDDHFEQITAENAEKISQFLAQKQVNVNLGGVRSREQAIAAYKLALFFAEMEGLAASHLAGLYLRLAWLFREGQDEEDEQVALSKAVEYYDQALSKERLPIGGMTEPALTYMIGELLRRTGKQEQSLQYFSKVVAMPQAKMEKKILDMAREAWHEAREKIKSAAAAE